MEGRRTLVLNISSSPRLIFQGTVQRCLFISAAASIIRPKLRMNQPAGREVCVCFNAGWRQITYTDDYVCNDIWQQGLKQIST